MPWLERVLSVVANVIQIGSLVYVLVSFWRARTRLLRYLRSRQQGETKRPWAMAIGLSGGDITGTVKACLQDLGLTMEIESISRDAVSADNSYGVLEELVKIKGRLTEAGVTEVHLFFKGPVTMAMAIGAATDNWVPIHVYEYTKGGYRPWMVLEKETVKGLSLAAEPPGLST